MCDNKFFSINRTDEPSLFEGRFIADDAKVSAFVDQIRSQMLSVRFYLSHFPLFFIYPSTACNRLYLLSEDWSWCLWASIIYSRQGNVPEVKGQGGWRGPAHSCVQAWNVAAGPEPLPWGSLCIPHVPAEGAGSSHKCNILLHGPYLQVFITIAKSLMQFSLI